MALPASAALLVPSASDATECSALFVALWDVSFDDAVVEADLGTAFRGEERIVDAIPPVAAEKPSGMSEVPKLCDTRLSRLLKVGEDVDCVGEEAFAAATDDLELALVVSMGGGKGSLSGGGEVAIEAFVRDCDMRGRLTVVLWIRVSC